MSEIICATNLRKDSDKVIQSAMYTAKLWNYKLKIVYVSEYSDYYYSFIQDTPMAQVEDTIWKQSYDGYVHKLITAQLERCKLDKKDVDFEVLGTNVATELKSYITKQSDPKFMVIGATHHGEVYRFFNGSFLEQALFNSHIDTLITKKALIQAPVKMGVLINDAQAYQVAMERTVKFAKEFQAEVVLINCSALTLFEGDKNYFDYLRKGENLSGLVEKEKENATEHSKKLVQGLESQGVKVIDSSVLTLHDDPVTKVEVLKKQHNIDFFVQEVKHHYRNHFVVGSLAYDLIRHIDSNFYVISRQ